MYKLLFFLSCLLVSINTNADKLLPINDYISQNWLNLERSVTYCAAYHDIKVKSDPLLYLPYHYKIDKRILAIAKKCKLQIAYLPRPIRAIDDVKTTDIKQHGLLYLPKSYIVPGGRFNEMYGWDSYFILLGLLHDGFYELANNIINNYIFEIQYYGGIINANRTYHLSRSQPPFFSSAVMAVYYHPHAGHFHDKKWLTYVYPFIKKEHDQWTKSPYLAGKTGLSRYYDKENTILIEALAYPHYYEKVIKFIKSNAQLTKKYLINKNGHYRLNPDFLRGERSLRASGFDITFRFGPFGAATHHYAAVCLNSLLYKTEMDLAQIAMLLDKKADHKKWLVQAAKRRQQMLKYLYDKKSGLFYDYDFTTKQQSNYLYATSFYPLWAKLVDKRQANKLIKQLPKLQAPGGISTSLSESGVQWDKPFGWAPMQFLITQGLLNYQAIRPACRVMQTFNRMVRDNYQQTGNIFEKYDVFTRNTTTPYLGYKENVIGFGWTNAVYAIFDNELINTCQQKLI